MQDVVNAAHEIQTFCLERQWRFCIIGGLAVIRWSEPRTTRDAHLTLLTGFGHEDQYAGILLRRFAPRIPNALEFARQNRILLLQDSNQVPIDVSFAGFPFEELAVERATWCKYAPGVSLLTCSAEDLMIFKRFASRPQDLIDASRIVDRAAGHLDWTYITTHLTPLAEIKEAHQIIDRLKELEHR